MLTKIGVLILGMGVNSKDVNDGYCPYKPGEVASKVKDNLDLKRIQGQWINYFDEKELKKKFLCMGAKLLIFDEKVPNELSF